MATNVVIYPVARAVPYDNTDCTLVAEDVKSALDELCVNASVSASPGLLYSRSGNITPNSWLKFGLVPSNTSGYTVFLYNAEIIRVFVANEDLDTFDVSVYTHDGKAINLALEGSVSMNGTARSTTFTTSIALAKDKQVAIRVRNGVSKNTVVGLLMRGTLTP